MAEKFLSLVGGVFQEVAAPSGGVPTLIMAGQTYSVAANIQALFTEEIDMEDGAEISVDANGVLVEVS